MTAVVPAPIPVPDPDTAGFWQASSQGVLAISRCIRCRRWQHPPLESCRWCDSTLAFEPVSGQGEVFSFILVRQATVPGHEVPYVVGLIALDESPEVRITGIVRGPVEAVAVGMRVRACLVALPGTSLRAPEFDPVQI